MEYISHYDSPLGGITLAGDGQALTGLWFDGQKYFAAGLDPEHEERETLIEDCRFMREILSDNSELEAERARLMEELTAVGLRTQKLVDKKAEGKLTTKKFDARHASYVKKYNDLQAKLKAIADSEKRKRQQILR